MADAYNEHATTLSDNRVDTSRAASPPAPAAAGHPDPAHALPAPSRGLPAGLWAFLAVVLLALAAAIVFGILHRGAHEHQLETSTNESATLIVNVVHPSATTSTSEIALPGNTTAFDDTPIYARTNGYLKKYYVDIGQRVSQGQLMAVIETPEKLTSSSRWPRPISRVRRPTLRWPTPPPSATKTCLSRIRFPSRKPMWQ